MPRLARKVLKWDFLGVCNFQVGWLECSDQFWFIWCSKIGPWPKHDFLSDTWMAYQYNHSFDESPRRSGLIFILVHNSNLKTWSIFSGISEPTAGRRLKRWQNRRINSSSSKTGIKAEAKMIRGFFDDDDVGGAPEHQTPIISMYYSSGP